jgi:transposase-like protein
MEREAVVAEYLESGLTQRVFALENGMSVSTLQLWLRQAESDAAARRHRKAGRSQTAPAVSLLEVELDDAPAPSALPAISYEIELGRDVRLRLPQGFGDGEVRRLLALLKETF